MPKSLIEKLGLAALDLFSLSREKTEKMIQVLVKKGQIAAEEGERIIRQLGKRGEEELKIIEKRVGELIKERGLATKKEIEKLRKEIEKLKAKIK